MINIEADKVLFWKEGKHWIIASRYVYLVVQGPTFEESMDRFKKSLIIMAAEYAMTGQTLPDIPLNILKKWEKKAYDYKKLLN